jgi:pyruvate dehydrogenase E1 component alpha subunit
VPEDAPMKNAPSVDQRIEMHRRMILTRLIEERLGQLQKEGRTRGPIHRCDGQEAVGIGATAALAETDYVTTTHRGHHVYIGKGLDPRRIIAEIFGRETGYCGGRAGHMLVADASRGMIGGNAIVGASIPAATGMALSAQILGSERVALAVFGDGAAQTGICHESMNIASLWKLPVVFLLEHNHYGLTVHHSAQSSVPDLSVRGAAYAIPAVMIDGNDVTEVYCAVASAADRARRGEGPTLIEAKTYRLEGFSTSDMGGYQSPADIAAWRERDPILLSARSLEAAIGPDRLEEIGRAAAEAAETAFAEALGDPPPAFEPHPQQRALRLRGGLIEAERINYA